MKKTSLALGLALSLAIVSCAKKNDPKVLVYGLYKEPAGLDNAMAVDLQSISVGSNICEGLVGYERENDLVVEPKLAKSFEVSADGKTYTFHLREGVKFHDGKDMDADSVLFSFDRQNNPNNPYYRAAYTYWAFNGLRDNLESMTKTDDKTVVFKLKSPDGSFLEKLTTQGAYVVSPDAFKKLGADEFNRAPVCSGPFVFKEWKKAQSILLEKNTAYWDEKNAPKVEKLLYKIVADASARYLGLKKGELDIAEEINPQDVKSIEENPDLQLIVKPTRYHTFLWMNAEHAPFNNYKVREALALLVDKQKIVDSALLGYAKAAENYPIPPENWAYDKTLKPYAPNLEKAKALLKEAGYPNGFDMDITYNKESADRKATAEILQYAFAQAGVRVAVKNTEWATYLDMVDRRTYRGAVILGFGVSYPDPSLYTIRFSKKWIEEGSNLSGWYDNRFDELNEAALKLNDEKKRAALYKESQAIFYRELPAVSLFDKVSLYGARKNVKGLVHPMLYPSLKHVSKN